VLVESVLEVAAGERGALGQADEPGPRPGISGLPALRTSAGLRTSIASPSPRRSLDAHVYGGRRRMLARVGQRLLLR
jgi:hypothetical protein